MQTPQFVSRLSARRLSLSDPMQADEDSTDYSLPNESVKQFMERLLYSYSERLELKANDRGKNQKLWSKYNIVYVDGEEQKYACCKFCNGFIKYSSRTGTGGLMRHACYKKANKLSSMISARGHQLMSEDVDKPTARLAIEALMQMNSPRIGYITKDRGKSEMWSQFKLVTVDGLPTTYASCRMCTGLVTYTSRTGTGGMSRHKCPYKPFTMKEEEGVVTQEEEGSNETEIVIKKEDSFNWDDKDGSEAGTGNEAETEEEEEVKAEAESRIPHEAERELNQKRYAVMDKSLQLLSSFYDEEFIDLAQLLVDLGAKYGQFDVRSVFETKNNPIAMYNNYK